MGTSSESDLHALFLDAVALHRTGRLNEAGRLYQRILQADSCHADALHSLGVLTQQLGHLDIAIDLIAKAITQNSQLPAYHNSLGSALQAQGLVSEAYASYRRALILRPDIPNVLYNAGNALKASGHPALAIISFQRALHLRGDYAEARSNLGDALMDHGRPDAAMGAYWLALVLRPDLAEIYSNLANVLNDRGRPVLAETVCRRALALNAALDAAHNNLGNARKGQGDLEAAAAAYRTALLSRPDTPHVHANLGMALQELGRLDEAAASYRRALVGRPDDSETLNLAVTLLLAGRLMEGWSAYEVRPLPPAPLDRPRWNGEDLAGRQLLLLAEQGMGDTLLFGRFIPLIAEDPRLLSSRVVLEVPLSMRQLLSPLADRVNLIVADDSPHDGPEFDVYSPLASLPLLFGTTLQTIPPPLSALLVEPERVAVWRKKIPKTGRRIGIAWQGNPSFPEDRRRSIPLAHFAPLADCPDVRLISLQTVHGLDQLDRLPVGMTVKTLGPGFDAGPDAFLDTAAAMMSLDLVITVDSAVAHLAGSLGRPVWLALARVPHWTWGLEGETTPWYPSMRLFRQTVRGEWSTVFARMAEALADWP